MAESANSVSKNEIFFKISPNFTVKNWDEYISGSSRCGAVLVPIVREVDKLMILFVRRQLFLRRHPGEIAFPGGQREKTDINPVDTALREMTEETGIEPGRIEVKAVMECEYTVASDFRVVPVVAELKTGFPPAMVLDENEISQAFFLDLREFSQKPRWNTFTYEGTKHCYPEYHVNNRILIWGLTARILYKLLKLIYPEVSQ